MHTYQDPHIETAYVFTKSNGRISNKNEHHKMTRLRKNTST